MKTLTFVFALALILGTTTLGFAGTQPAVKYPAGQFATAGGNVQVTPWAKGVHQYPGGVVVVNPGNGICPVMNNPIKSKHNLEIALSNGKHMTVCCVPCKGTIEKDLRKFQAFMY